MKTKNKAGSLLANLLPYLIFLLAFVLILNVVFSLKNKKIPTVFGFGAALVLTNSMEDTIMTGDLILLRTVDPSTLEVDDIITFWQPGAETRITITHRIIAISETPEGRLFTTQGDNNNASLAWEIEFSDEYYIGKYIAKSTILGNIYSWFVSAGVGIIYIFVIIIFLSIAFMEGKNIVKELTIARKKQLDEQRQALVEAELARLREEHESELPKEVNPD